MELKKHLLPIQEYKEPIEFADKQWKIFWFPDEIKVEKDIQDVLVNFTEAEKHAVITTLKLFSLYETHAGDEYWLGRYRKIFEGAEFHRMASVFGAFELAVHAPFYNKINELLHINTPEFFLSYQDVPALKQRIDFIGEMIDHPDDLVSLAAFSMVEGVILYSSFAFLKHYQAKGKNKLLNTVRGINFSLRDENLHSLAGAWSFKLKKKLSNLSVEEQDKLREKIIEIAKIIYLHEKEIIELTFSKGNIEGITAHQIDNFVQSRINLCLVELGYDPIYEVTYNPIAETFYKAIGDFSYNDIFSGVGAEYHRGWDEEGFVYKKKEQE